MKSSVSYIFRPRNIILCFFIVKEKEAVKGIFPLLYGIGIVSERLNLDVKLNIILPPKMWGENNREKRRGKMFTPWRKECKRGKSPFWTSWQCFYQAFAIRYRKWWQLLKYCFCWGIFSGAQEYEPYYFFPSAQKKKTQQNNLSISDVHQCVIQPKKSRQGKKDDHYRAALSSFSK